MWKPWRRLCPETRPRTLRRCSCFVMQASPPLRHGCRNPDVTGVANRDRPSPVQPAVAGWVPPAVANTNGVSRPRPTPQAWQAFLRQPDDPREIAMRRRATPTGRPLPGDSTMSKLEKLVGRPLRALPPRKAKERQIARRYLIGDGPQHRRTTTAEASSTDGHPAFTVPW